MDQNTNQSRSQEGNASQVNTISLVADQTVVLNFQLNDIAELSVNGNNLVFTLTSGDEFVLEEYATFANEIEGIEFAGGELIPGDAYLNDFGDIDTAAGPGAGGTTVGGGVGSPPAPETSINDSLSKIGVQPDIFKGDGVEFSAEALDGVPFVTLNPDFELTPFVLDETFLDSGDLSVSADFSDAFIYGFGIDGPGSAVYSLDLTVNGIDSGLFALGVDGAPGESILLQDVGGRIVGYTGEGGTYKEYFAIEVDGVGVVTFTHLAAIYHPEGGDAHNDLVTLTLASPDLLVLTLTVSDIDGQSASASLNLGEGVFSILDDGPNAEALTDVSAGINLTEDDDDNEPSYPDDDYGDFNMRAIGPQADLDTVTIASGVIQGLFATPDFGEDGPGGVTYSLTVGNSETGLYLTGQRPQPEETDEEVVDPQIILLLNGDGTLIEGVAGDGTIAFTVTIDPDTGEVTVTQMATLDHPDTEDHNDIVDIPGIAVTQTIVDADNDVDSAISADLNITITDDGPSFINPPQHGEFESDMVLDNQGDGVTVLHGTIVPEMGDNQQQGSSVDQLYFHHNGGSLSIALTSERYGAGDVDGDGHITNLDTYIHLYTAAGVFVASNDDGGYGFDSLLTFGNLGADDYILYVGAYRLEADELVNDFNDDDDGISSFVGTLGGYRVTLTGDVAPLGVAEVDETAVRENPHVEGIAFGDADVDGSFSFEVGADKTNASLDVDGTVIQLYDDNGIFVAQNTTVSNDWRDISLQFSENSFTGEITVTYVYTLTDAYPHESDPNADEYTDTLAVTVIDGDGDSVTETISVIINDDMPYVLAERETETILGDETEGLVVFPETFGTDVSHDFDVRFGADGPNSETPIVLAMGVDDNFLWVEDTSGGVDIGTLYYSQDNSLNSESLNDNNATWKIIVRYEEDDSGDNHDFNYQFIQLNPIDHDDTTDPDETEIWNVMVTSMDGDGDTVESSMVIMIDDDGPTLNGLDAGREGRVFESALRENMHVEGRPTTSGRFDEIARGSFDFDTGTDEPGATLTIAGETVVLLAGDDAFTVDTAFGEVYAELTYGGDGEYTVDWRYTLTTVPDNDAVTQPQVDGVSLRVNGNRVFEDIAVVITDGDGDTTRDELNIRIVDDEPFVVHSPERIVGDETGDLVTDSGDFDVRFGADGAHLETPIVLDMGLGANHLWVEDTAGGDHIGTLYYSQDGSIASGDLDDSNASWKIIVTYDEATSGNNHDYNYQFIQLRAIDHPNPEDHDEPASWRVAVTTMDGDGDTVSSAMRIRIEDDGPVIVSDDIDDIDGFYDDETFGMVNHSGHTLINVDYGTDSDGHIELSLLGNESGLAVWDQAAGTLTYYQYAADANNLGQATWVVTVHEDSQNPGSFTYDFNQLDNIHHSNPNDHDEAENYSISVTAFDGDGDSVVAGQTLDIKIEDSGVSILNLGGYNEGTVYESALRNQAEGEGNPTQYYDEVASGFFNIYVGADKSGDVGSVATLSIAGQDIPLYDANDNFIGGPANISTSFGDLAVSFAPYGNSGWAKVNWTYTLTEVPDGDSELPDNVTSFQSYHFDGVQEHLAVVLTDSDGDTTEKSLDIAIVDDGPNIGYWHTHVNEDETDDIDGVAITAASGVLDMITGADGLGSVELSLITSSDDPYLSDSQKTGSYSEWDSNTQTLTYYQDGQGTDPTWTVEVFFNSTTGQYNYNFTQLDAVDHPNPLDADETANFLLNITLYDGDGDDASTIGQWWGGQLRLSIDDDGPVAVDDAALITEDDTPNTVSGNVVTGASGTGADTVGADVNINPVTPFDDDLTYGHLELYSDGTYIYTLDNENSAVNALNENSVPLIDEYTYTLTDGDGDSTTAKLTITIHGHNDAPPEFSIAPTSVRVSEEGLEAFDGIKDDIGYPDDTADITNEVEATGTFTVSDADTPISDLSVSFNATSVTALNSANITSGGVDVTFVISGDNNEILTGYVGAGRTEGDRAVQLTLGSIDNDGKGTYDVILYKPFDHEDGLGENLLDLNVGIEVTDGQATSVESFNVTIEDDSPVSGDFNHTLEIQPQHTNLMFIVDTSGSMRFDAETGEDPLNGGSITSVERMELLLTSVREVITSYDDLGDIRVQIVTFDAGNDSTSRPIWLTGQEALAFIGNGEPRTPLNPDGRDPLLEPGGGTDYDRAVFETSNFDRGFNNPGKLDALDYPADHIVKNVSYFLSDGQPNNVDREITGSEITDWTNFLTANKIDSYAVGFGSNLNDPLVKPDALAALDPIAYDGIKAADGQLSEAERDGHIVENSSELASDLLSTITQPVTGAIFGDMSGTGFGADGGDFLDITIGGIVYAWDGTANGGVGQISVDGDAALLGPGSSTTIVTDQDGKLWVDFATGEYKYTPDPEMPVGSQYVETFTYRIEDRDGDPGEGTVNLNISRDEVPSGNDVSLANFAVEDHYLIIENPGSMTVTDNTVLRAEASPPNNGLDSVSTAIFPVMTNSEVKVVVRTNGYQRRVDEVKIELFKVGVPDAVSSVPKILGGKKTYSFDVTSAGSYYIKVTVDDNTLRNNGYDLKATILGVTYSYVPDSQIEWQGVVPAEGNLLDAYDFGNDDPVELIVYDNGVPVAFNGGVATIIGANGVTTVYANGDYRYSPTAETDFVDNPGDSLSFALVQGDTVVNGTVDFEIKDHLADDKGVDVIIGTDSNEAIYGLAGDDEIHGGAGDDVIDGGAGKDILYGGDNGDEADTLIGGLGEDIFIAGKGDTLVLTDTDNAQDTIYIATEMLQSGDEGVVVNIIDFMTGQDTIQLEAGLNLSQPVGSDPTQLTVTSGAGVDEKTMVLQFDHPVDISNITSDASNPTPEELDVINSLINSHG